MQEFTLNQVREMEFFKKFSNEASFKFTERLKYLYANKAGLLKMIPLSMPIRGVPGKYKHAILRLKLKVDLAVVKDRMPSFFLNGSLSFCGYSLSPLHKERREDETTRIFSAIELIREIGVEGQYRAQDFLGGSSKAVVLDCGANIGIFSLFASHVNKTSEIYAFEPSSGIFKILEEIVSVNGIGNIHPCKFALGERNEEVSLLTVEDGLGVSNVVEDSSFREYHPIKYPHKEKIRMLTIDEFVFNIKKFNRVDFIKIDTEGYERQVLKGAAETIRKFHPVIACSAYHLPDDKQVIPPLVLKLYSEYQHCLESRGEEDFIFWTGADRLPGSKTP